MTASQSNIALIKSDAEKGVVLAQYTLAWKYYTGTGLQRDYAQARSWYEKAAERGDVTSQFLMYTLCLKGIGTAKHLNKAVEWLSKAANSGNVEAQARLGYHYLRGDGVPKDPVMGYAWMYLAKAYGYRHWYNRLMLFWVPKSLSPDELQKSVRFITEWQEERRRKLTGLSASS